MKVKSAFWIWNYSYADLATANFWSDNVTILLNNMPQARK